MEAGSKYLLKAAADEACYVADDEDGGVADDFGG